MDNIIFHILGAGNIEVVEEEINVSVGVSEMLDKVVITKKAEAPVDKREENKDAWDNLSFCNE